MVLLFYCLVVIVSVLIQTLLCTTEPSCSFSLLPVSEIYCLPSPGPGDWSTVKPNKMKKLWTLYKRHKEVMLSPPARVFVCSSEGFRKKQLYWTDFNKTWWTDERTCNVGVDPGILFSVCDIKRCLTLSQGLIHGSLMAYSGGWYLFSCLWHLVRIWQIWMWSLVCALVHEIKRISASTCECVSVKRQRRRRRAKGFALVEN